MTTSSSRGVVSMSMSMRAMALTQEVLVALSRYVMTTRTWLVVTPQAGDRGCCCCIVGLSETLGVTKKILCENPPLSFIDESTWLVSESKLGSSSCISVVWDTASDGAVVKTTLNWVFSFYPPPQITCNSRWIVAITGKILLIWRVVNSQPQLDEMRKLILPVSTEWSINLTRYLPPKGDVLTLVGTAAEEMSVRVCQLDLASTHSSGSFVGPTFRFIRQAESSASGLLLTRTGTLAVMFSGAAPHLIFVQETNTEAGCESPTTVGKKISLPKATNGGGWTIMTPVAPRQYILQQAEEDPNSTTTINIYSLDSLILNENDSTAPEYKLHVPPWHSNLRWIGYGLVLLTDTLSFVPTSTIMDTATNSVVLRLEGSTIISVSSHSILSP
ncbi:hypothetical protein Pelo_6862 [Pelomyxa schiedti]|nr:hypothetical protein Pelo_6862 [Pelomyxa schiedti]